GESYILAWPDEETGAPEAYYHDPRNAHVFYEAARPRVKRFGCKWWVGDDGYRYLTLYYPDRLEYYRSRKQVQSQRSGIVYTNEVTSGKSFDKLNEPAANPYGLVPLFHFRTGRTRPISELQNIIEPQN